MVTFDRFFVFALESQELNINLDLMTGHLFLVTLGVDFAQPCAARQPTDSIALENAVNAGTGCFDVVVALVNTKQCGSAPDGKSVEDTIPSQQSRPTLGWDMTLRLAFY